jgi:hypothetical protein
MDEDEIKTLRENGWMYARPDSMIILEATFENDYPGRTLASIALVRATEYGIAVQFNYS